MCGIVGIVHGNGQCYKTVIPNMLKTIRHRGPDGWGEKYYPCCALGHVRLSIVDLKNGEQPMTDPSGDVSIVFNGEIYGYNDIKKQLSYYYQTDSDTEVLLALYNKYKTNMMPYVPGMFAFALWDETKKILFCARDRFGEKPFFYAIGKHGEFIFASEIKAILASGLIKPKLDMGQIRHYLSYSYVYPTKTIYKNIYTLPPGCSLTFHKGHYNLERYWTLPQQKIQNIDIADAVDEFRRLFIQAVKRQLVADVPVGAFLSGGMDSGSVVAIAAEMMPNLTTISFGFPGWVNELSLAKTMANKYHTNHIELNDIDFNIAELMITLQNIYDEPMADPASIPAYLIAKQARKYVKVVLTGDGGDEILGGYDFKYRVLSYMMNYKAGDIFFSEYILDIYYKIFRTMRRIVQQLGWYPNNPSVRLHELRYHDIFLRKKAFDWLREGDFNVIHLMRKKNKTVSDLEIQSLHMQASNNNEYLIDYGFLEYNDLDNAVRLDLQEYLPGNGMRKTDRTTMAVGLESRTPFLDIDFASFCISLPFCLKLRDQQEKYLLRKAFSDKWSREVRSTIKNGFSAPFWVWMNQESVMQLEEEYLGKSGKKIFQIIDYVATKKIRTERENILFIWELLILSMWLELHSVSV